MPDECDDVVIETERLLLRNWREADRAEMFAHLTSQPAVMEHMGGPQTREESDAGIDRCIASQSKNGHCFWALERKDNGLFLGFCGLKRVDGDGAPDLGSPEIGWRLRQEAWGQGFAKESAIASMDFAFDQLDAEFVSAFTIDGNTSSWGLMKRLGMTRRPDLDYWDAKWGPVVGPEIVYRIVAKDWAQTRKDLT
ncbi:GNAT family N-acetyltransferase [Parasphingopyxis sp. CP4]|uniref:GNAT family N-acetyltransferase n=1 Tax=Parasphingopyxis sp. CP4 TaxID=2724527 RepID=UPI0015A07957|nr:GNAT family N-acetyltransferase [Parasphingopyxis sp. CP4]QLC21340.1 GNAT family N-acetyltransferase [Parasphingopyxis sp. CP4]